MPHQPKEPFVSAIDFAFPTMSADYPAVERNVSVAETKLSQKVSALSASITGPVDLIFKDPLDGAI